MEDTTLTFSPLVASGSVAGRRQWWEKKSGPSSLEVPFRYEHAGAVFDGALRLAPTTTPLSCDWHQRSDVPTLIRAWSLALEAYAELTCPAPAWGR